MNKAFGFTGRAGTARIEDKEKRDDGPGKGN